MFSCLLVRNQVWAALVTKFPRRLINPKPWSNDPINPITPKSGTVIPKKRNVYLEVGGGGGQLRGQVKRGVARHICDTRPPLHI